MIVLSKKSELKQNVISVENVTLVALDPAYACIFWPQSLKRIRPHYSGT